MRSTLPAITEEQPGGLTSDARSNVGSIFGSIVRAGLNTAPFTGGIASLWSDWDTSRRFQRVERAIADLIAELDSLREKFDPQQLGEAEMQLLEIGLERISREHREGKRKLFVQLLATSWVETTIRFDERRRFIDALDAFDETHLGILRFLRARGEAGLEPIAVTQLLTEAFASRSDEEFKFSIFMPAMNQLAAEYGFVRRRRDEKTGGVLMRGINSDGLTFHAVCLLSALGKRFIDFVDRSGD